MLGSRSFENDLFETIAQNYPGLATNNWNVAKNAILGVKRFDLVKKRVGKPIQ